MYHQLRANVVESAANCAVDLAKRAATFRALAADAPLSLHSVAERMLQAAADLEAKARELAAVSLARPPGPEAMSPADSRCKLPA